MEHLSLFELNKQISDVLAKNMEPSYWVIAEIGEMRHTHKGHCYLELVEKEGNVIKAKNRATIWSYTWRNLGTWFEGITGQSLKAGMKILFNATIQYHEVYGFSLNIRDIDAQYTIGERAVKRQEIIQKLVDDGVFEMNKELELPTVPQRIAVISSESAAGFGDFMDQLSTNEHAYVFDVQLFQSTMQGDQAEASIISSMHQVFDRVEEFDLLVIIRGGGASLDLDCFDSYELGIHIAQFPIPVVTGIGHERDETIADLVAHTKMKTPTAVSEFILSGMNTFESLLDEKFSFLANTLNESIGEELAILDQLSNRFQRISQQMLNEQKSKLMSLIQQLKFNQHNRIKDHELQLDGFRKSISKLPLRIIDHQHEAIKHLEKELEIINPQNVFKRGYSLTLIDGINVNRFEKLEDDARLTTITEKVELQSVLVKKKLRTNK
jgi:exodeoxyribonuclease VII large subunit